MISMQGWGRIVNVASVHGLVGSSLDSFFFLSLKLTDFSSQVGLRCRQTWRYWTYQGSMSILTEIFFSVPQVIGQETAGKGVTCNSVCPGWVLTPLVDAQIHARFDTCRTRTFLKIT